VSGVGWNVAKALTTLGDDVRFLALIGRDLVGGLVAPELAAASIPAEGVLPLLEETPQSVIMFEPDGRRQIHVDLKDIQERTYPADRLEAALAGCDLAVLCNINFARPFLAVARSRGIPVATDVHAISDLDDPYNRDWMTGSSILFQSDELLPCSPEEWAGRILARPGPETVVIGMGGRGALLARRGTEPLRVPAVRTRPVVNTIGAGDALFSSFVHQVAGGVEPREALRKAAVFASYKIGTRGAADGFLDARALDELYARVSSGM
jgi:ribokinase